MFHAARRTDSCCFHVAFGPVPGGEGSPLSPGTPLTCALCPAVCSIRVIGESDIMQEFLSESDEVGT